MTLTVTLRGIPPCMGHRGYVGYTYMCSATDRVLCEGGVGMGGECLHTRLARVLMSYRTRSIRMCVLRTILLYANALNLRY